MTIPQTPDGPLVSPRVAADLNGTAPRPRVEYAPGWVDRIPEELKHRRQWVVWRFEWRTDKAGAGKWTKVPYQPRSAGRRRPKAKADAPETWGTFAEALAAYQANAGRTDAECLDGIGYEFATDDGFAGVDFDDCLTADGELLEWAADWLDRLSPTYAEVSPSGSGIKAFYRGCLPAKPDGSTGRRRAGYGPDGSGAIETYDHGRYFTLTGARWWADHAMVAEPASSALADLATELDAGRMGARKRTKGKAEANGKAETAASTEPPPVVDPCRKATLDQCSDDDLLAWAHKAKNGAKFSALYDAGDCSGYPSDSEADCALLVRLAYWTGADAARMERLFDGSALARREKWTERPDYRARSIASAIELNRGAAPDLAETRYEKDPGDGGYYMETRPKAPPSKPRWGTVEGVEANGQPGAKGHHAMKGDGRGGAAGDDQAAEPRPEPIHPNESADDPSRLARLFLDNRCRHPDGLTLRFWQGDYVEWAGAYRTVLAEDVRARLHPVIKAEFDRLNVEEIARWQRDQSAEVGGGFDTGKKGPPKVRKVTGELVSNTVLALSGYTRVEPRTPQPSWLAGDAPFPAEDVLPTRNALVYLPGLVGGSPDAIHPPTPRYFCPYALDYDFEPDAPRPDRWFAFLDSIWPDEPETIATLQEWFGHLLTPDTTHQKILIMIGPKRSGKGTVARIIKAMIGADNVANPTFAGLATNFGLAPLIGKPAAIITDARLSGRTDIAQVVERLLSISGEDSQTIDRKHLPAVTVKLPTRFTLISNELPRLTDTSGALAGRLILLRMTRSFYGEEDRNLTAALLAEQPGILLWAIGGWQRLRDRGRFVQPEAGKAMVEEMEDLASPVGAFLKDRCRIEAGAEVMAATLYLAWKTWCLEHGRDNPGDELVFGRNLRAVLPNLHTTHRRLSDETRKRFYEGIRLLDLPPNWS